MYPAEVRSDLGANRARLAVSVHRTEVSGIFQQFCRHLLDGQNMVHQTGGDGAPQDRVVLGRLQRLGHGHAAEFLDGSQAECAVGTGAREHNADGVFAAVLRQ